MPYPNEHAARLQPPEQFDRFRRQVDAFADGIDAIYASTKGGTSVLQSVRFKAARYTAAEAREWLAAHDYRPILFEPATGAGDMSTTTIVECNVAGTPFDSVETAAGQALEASSGVTCKARIYEPGGVRLLTAPRLTPAGMDNVSQSLAGSPINYEHRAISDVDPLQGVVRGAWVEDGAIYSELHLTGDRVLAELSAGIVPGFSVEYTYGLASVTCGTCGEPWFDTASSCTHVPGQVVEGEATYIEASDAEGVGLAWTARPAARHTGIVTGEARASSAQAVDLMAPALARLSKITNTTTTTTTTMRGDMPETIEQVEAVEAAAPAEAVEAQADLECRLAAAEAENSILRERMVDVEAAQLRAEATARAGANRQKVIDLARAGKVADIRALIALRAKAPAELASFADVEAFVDSVIDCATGSGVRTGQLSEAVISADVDAPTTRAGLERRAVQLAAEKSIPFSQARRMAYAEAEK